MTNVEKEVLNLGMNRATQEFSNKIEALGFQHTKKWYWVRTKENSADFLHIHRIGSSYGDAINYSVSFRIHCGNRLFSETSKSLALNGPNSDDPMYRSKRYHLRFNAKSGSTFERCIDDLMRFSIEIAEPWFSQKGKAHKGSSLNVSIESQKLSHIALGIK